MIIAKIRAQNVLKYAELSIDLAERGLIAISGHNESGKSSIGETVCFALFGRTFSIPPADIHKVVRWGQSHCNVTLDFAVEDQPYVLSRFLDRDGNHSAKLATPDDPENPLARGVQAVSDALFGILGFEYEEFVESFYLAQREITTPHPHSHAVKIMAGVAPLQQVMRCLNNEITEREELLGEIKAEWDSVDYDIKALAIQDGRLVGLEEERHRNHHELDQIRRLNAEIESQVEVVRENAPQIRAAQGARGRNAVLRFLVFVIGAVAAAIWGLLTHGGDLPQSQQLQELLSQRLPEWDAEKLLWVGYAAAGLGVLFLLLWIRGAGLKRRVRNLKVASGQLGETLARARVIDVEDVPDEAAGDADDQQPGYFDEDPSSDLMALSGVPSRPEYAQFETLRGLLDQGEASVQMVQDYSRRELAWLGYIADRLSEQQASLEDAIDDEQSRLQEAANLEDVLDGLKEKRNEVSGRIADRQRGLELLTGAIAELSNDFNRDVKELVGRMLPLFTDGRYEHLQIDEGLKVRVFSSDKRDFMDLEEVSSGTQRQIMLALRLALSKKLLGRTVKGKQFAFLDEPFAFFDEERTRRALHALADLGDDISQVWIVAQDFPKNCEVQFDTKIECQRGNDTLIVSG